MGFSERCGGGAPCVTLNECTQLYNQLQQGTTPQLTALLRSLHCGFEYNTPMVGHPQLQNAKKPIFPHSSAQ